jgi:hypothetical protein
VYQNHDYQNDVILPRWLNDGSQFGSASIIIIIIIIIMMVLES